MGEDLGEFWGRGFLWLNHPRRFGRQRFHNCGRRAKFFPSVDARLSGQMTPSKWAMAAFGLRRERCTSLLEQILPLLEQLDRVRVPLDELEQAKPGE